MGPKSAPADSTVVVARPILPSNPSNVYPAARFVDAARRLRTAEPGESETNAAPDCVRIRHLLVSDKSLSLYAHNVKIFMAQGIVTLRGPVRSEEERNKIVSIAARVVVPEKLADELTIRIR